MHTSGTRTWGWGVKICALCIGLVVWLILGEATLRIYFAIEDGLAEDKSRRLEILPDSERGYGMKPENGPPGFNSLGFRDHEFVIDKPPDVTRIIMLGDSITMGNGVEWNQTTSFYLENLLNQSNEETRYDVVNLGISGYNSTQERATLQEVGLQLQPDVVVLNVCLNDSDSYNAIRNGGLVSHAKISRFSDINLRTLISSSYLLSFSKDRITSFLRSYYPNILSTLNNPKLLINLRVNELAWKKMKDEMLLIKEIAEANNAVFVAFIYPYKSQVNLPNDQLMPQNDLMKFFESHDMLAKDLIDVFRSATEDMYIDAVIHLSPYGAQRVSHSIEEFLRNHVE